MRMPRSLSSASIAGFQIGLALPSKVLSMTIVVLEIFFVKFGIWMNLSRFHHDRIGNLRRLERTHDPRSVAG
jgi:hypothetical protein